jgi:hypothetical protein
MGQLLQALATDTDTVKISINTSKYRFIIHKINHISLYREFPGFIIKFYALFFHIYRK